MNSDREGVPEIRSADSRFRYLFSSSADSIYPIRIFRFQDGKLLTVTRQFRYQIRQAERRSWSIARVLVRPDPQPAHGAGGLGGEQVPAR